VQQILRLLAEPTRLRIVAAVDLGELAVNEIAAVLNMSASRISNHLRLLKDGGAIADRREGAWTFYRNALRSTSETERLWTAVLEGTRETPSLKDDAARRKSVLERRRERSRVHFSSHGTGDIQLERGGLRDEVLAAALPREWVAVDIGCGDGYLTERLAERFRKVIAVDHSPERLQAARERVAAASVEFHLGEVDALPVADASADAVFLSMVLHHVPEIGTALAEAFRVLRPGGRIVVADLAPHNEEHLRQKMGDLRLGLEPGPLATAMRSAGFRKVRHGHADDRLIAGKHKNLELFLATGERPAEAGPARKRKRNSQGSQS